MDKKIEDGDFQIHVQTNLMPERADAKQIADAYRARWTIKELFQELTKMLRASAGQVRTLGYPKAALFSFAMAVLAWNVYVVAKRRSAPHMAESGLRNVVL